MNVCSHGYNRGAMLRWRHSLTKRLVLAMLLVVANLHFCREQFFLPDGALCVTCPTLEHENAETPSQALKASNDHGDCHDCCTVKPCDDETPDDVAAQASSLVIPIAVLAERAPTLRLPLIELVPCEYLVLAGHPPTGPPIEILGRGPPSIS
jgi:hypothetical protein